ncbi:MAG: hypothetical protein SFY81_08375 [Verrucomicrobiota bacterium]|nr:hypothetical protein [Verrucomicrobiota bacterium]
MTKKTLLFCLVAFAVSASVHASETYAVLSLGTRDDAKTWADGMRTNLKVTRGIEIREPRPSLARLKEFFSRSDHWLFFGGHFSDHLYNDAKTIHIYFESSQVRLIYDEQEHILKKSEGFKQSANAKTVFWGGCNIHSDENRVKTIRELFGKQAVYVGWIGITGWEIVNINLGSNGQSPNFFTNMKGKADPAQVRQSWLESADNINWDRDNQGNPVRPKFSVIESSGQEWVLTGDLQPKKGSKKGRHF